MGCGWGVPVPDKKVEHRTAHLRLLVYFYVLFVLYILSYLLLYFLFPFCLLYFLC